MTAAERNDLLTPAEVAVLFRVNPKTVTRWARAGKLSATGVPGSGRALTHLRSSPPRAPVISVSRRRTSPRPLRRLRWKNPRGGAGGSWPGVPVRRSRRGHRPAGGHLRRSARRSPPAVGRRLPPQGGNRCGFALRRGRPVTAPGGGCPLPRICCLRGALPSSGPQQVPRAPNGVDHAGPMGLELSAQGAHVDLGQVGVGVVIPDLAEELALGHDPGAVANEYPE